jgi:hypothetical protein
LESSFRFSTFGNFTLEKPMMDRQVTMEAHELSDVSCLNWACWIQSLVAFFRASSLEIFDWNTITMSNPKSKNYQCDGFRVPIGLFLAARRPSWLAQNLIRLVGLCPNCWQTSTPKSGLGSLWAEHG